MRPATTFPKVCYRGGVASIRSTPASDAWRALLIAFTSIRDELADDLLEHADVRIEHYEILLMLYTAGDDGLRPSAIAKQRRITRSGATRLIDRLVHKGIVDRRTCGSDGRGSVIVLAERGREIFMRAGRAHLASIDRHVGAKLTEEEAHQLTELLRKLHIDESPERASTTCP